LLEELGGGLQFSFEGQFGRDGVELDVQPRGFLDSLVGEGNRFRDFRIAEVVDFVQQEENPVRVLLYVL